MTRKIVCRVCDSERFRKVVVTLSSGKNRVTDFVYCLRCTAMFFRPDNPPVSPAPIVESNVSNFTHHIPVNMTAALISTFPDPNVAKIDSKAVHYSHETFGHLLLMFKVVEAKHLGGDNKMWQLVKAKRVRE